MLSLVCHCPANPSLDEAVVERGRERRMTSSDFVVTSYGDSTFVER